MRGSSARRPFVARAGWSIVDQILSSATNVVASIVAAKAAGVREFGGFGLAMATYVLALGVSRSIATDPFVVRFSAVPDDDRSAAAGPAVGAALVCGLVFGALCVAVATIVGGPVKGPLAALGIVLPGLLVQDAWRFIFFAAGRPKSAALNDLAWAAVQVIACAALFAGHRLDAASSVVCWGAGALIGALLGCVQFRRLPAPIQIYHWWSDHRDLASRFLTDYAGVIGSTQATIYGLGWLAGLKAVGAFRASQVVFGPFTILTIGISAAALPEAARLRRVSHSRLWKLLIVVATVLAGSALFVGLVILVMPPAVGRAALGASWDVARPLLIPATLNLVAASWVGVAALGLRAVEAADRIVRARFIAAPVTLALGLGGAAINGAIGTAWGLAIANVIAALVWWHEFGLGFRSDSGRSRQEQLAAVVA